jgi:nucleotide-binding universal stress UspA family protein
MKIGKILFPTDLSSQAEPASRLAKTLAKQYGAELFLLHSVLTHEHDFRQLGELLDDFLDKVERENLAVLERQATALKKEGFVVSYAVDRHPSAYEAIMDKIDSWKPDLVVMGTHGLSGVQRWFIGSVAEKVVRHAPVPVMTVRSDAKVPPKIENILVPVDFSEGSRRAVAAASGMRGDGTTLVLLHVVLNPAFAGLHPGEYVRIFSVDPTLPDRIRSRMTEWMEGQEFEADVRESEDVAQSILEIAKERDVDLVVIGTKGLTGFDYFLMGSVAEKVVRFAPVPVLSVK